MTQASKNFGFLLAIFRGGQIRIFSCFRRRHDPTPFNSPSVNPAASAKCSVHGNKLSDIEESFGKFKSNQIHVFGRKQYIYLIEMSFDRCFIRPGELM